MMKFEREEGMVLRMVCIRSQEEATRSNTKNDELDFVERNVPWHDLRLEASPLLAHRAR
jgi:hypothetical protein